MTLLSSCNIIEKGADTDVFILHGFRSCQSWNIALKQYLKTKNVNIISCTARGHGMRMLDGHDWELDQTVQEYHAAIRKRAEETSHKIILIGHSMGGSQALVLGMTNPYVTKVIGIAAMHDNSMLINNPITPTQKFFRRIRPFNKLAIANQYSFPINFPACQPQYAEKIFLAHNTNDQIVEINQTDKNQQYLCLPDQNVFKYNGKEIFGHRQITAIPYIKSFLDQLIP